MSAPDDLVSDFPDEATQVAWRVANVRGWPEWMQSPALGRSITPVVRRVIEALDAHRATKAHPADLVTALADFMYDAQVEHHTSEKVARAVLASGLVVSRTAVLRLADGDGPRQDITSEELRNLIPGTPQEKR